MAAPTFKFEVTANDAAPNANPPRASTITQFGVEAFEGEERISQPFEYRLRLRHADANLDFSKVVNQEASLTMAQDALDVPGAPATPAQAAVAAKYVTTKVLISGIVSSFRITKKFDNGHVECEAVLVPKLWRLKMFHGTQVFQGLTVKEIVKKAFDPVLLPTDYEFKLKDEAVYLKREFTMQYQESNLDFVQRLLEHEGIYYYYDGGKLILTDDASGTAPGMRDRRGIRFEETQAPSDDKVYRFVYNEQVVPASVTVMDYDFGSFRQEDSAQHPPPPSSSAASGSAGAAAPSPPPRSGDYARVGAYYEHGRFAVDDKDWKSTKSEDDGGDAATKANKRREDQIIRIARVRAEELEARRKVVEGSSNATRVQAGHVLDLVEHFRFNDTYLITSVRHTYDKNSAYENTFTCLPASVQYRPPRITPVPRIPGIMTAKVKGAPPANAQDTSALQDRPAYIDEEGNYRVHFPFAPSPSNGSGVTEPSPPLRLAQPYAGPDYGFHFPNRAEAEMVFACLDGDPDQPLGLSVVPNPWTHTPVPNNKLTLGSQNPVSGTAVGGDNPLTTIEEDASGESPFANTKHVIRTHHGHQIVMDDDSGGANVGITIETGVAENTKGRNLYWGSKIELGGYRHMSKLEWGLGVASQMVGWFKNLFSRDFPSLAADAATAIASAVNADDYLDDTFGTTTPIGINISTNKTVGIIGKDGVNITSPNLFGLFSSSIVGVDDNTKKGQYIAEAIAKFFINTVWQDFMKSTADELLAAKEARKEYEQKSFTHPIASAVLKWNENFKKQRVTDLFYTLLQRTGVNIFSAGELKMASMQSTSVSAGQGGLALKSFGSIEQKANFGFEISSHQGIKLSTKGKHYKGEGLDKLVDKFATAAGAVFPPALVLKSLIGQDIKPDPAARFGIDIENEAGNIFIHAGKEKGEGDIMIHNEGSGHIRNFVEKGKIHVWSGGEGVIVEVGSRNNMKGDKGLEELPTTGENKADARLVMDKNTIHGFSAKHIQLAVAKDYSKDDSAITIREGELEIKCGQASILLKKNGDITLKGKNLKVEATADVAIEGLNIASKAKKELKMEGLNMKAKATVKTDLEGLMTTLKGSTTFVKGSIVKIGS